MLCLQTRQLEKSHAYFEKDLQIDVCGCETQFFIFFAVNKLHRVPSGTAEYSFNFWRTAHRKYFSGFIGLHLLYKGIQIRHNFPAEIKAEFPAGVIHARSVLAASPHNRPTTVLCAVCFILRNLPTTTCLLWPFLSYLLTFLRLPRFLLESSLGVQFLMLFWGVFCLFLCWVCVCVCVWKFVVFF